MHLFYLAEASKGVKKLGTLPTIGATPAKLPSKAAKLKAKGVKNRKKSKGKKNRKKSKGVKKPKKSKGVKKPKKSKGVKKPKKSKGRKKPKKSKGGKKARPSAGKARKAGKLKAKGLKKQRKTYWTKWINDYDPYEKGAIGDVEQRTLIEPVSVPI